MKTAGVDIGGTQLRVGIFDEEYRLVSSFKTANDQSRSAGENMEPIIDFLLENRADLKGVGIGCPGPVSLRQGKIINPSNLVRWHDFEIVRFMEQHVQLPVFFNNDGNIAGLAEAVLGAGKGYESVAFLGISTGFGGAFIYNGKIMGGAHDNCAEYWNMIVNEYPCGRLNANDGCLNEQPCGGGLGRIATKRYGREMNARELFALYGRGDAIAREIIEFQAETLAKGIANISCTLDPAVFVVGGSVAIHNWFFIEMAVERAAKYINYAPEELIVKPAVFGDDAGLIGAALLV
ncbi:MAG: ROK family protein [Clostridia bacterium]|nr:ROK family protein [Clostridia bacterium]